MGRNYKADKASNPNWKWDITTNSQDLRGDPLRTPNISSGYMDLPPLPDSERPKHVCWVVDMGNFY